MKKYTCVRCSTVCASVTPQKTVICPSCGHGFLGRATTPRIRKKEAPPPAPQVSPGLIAAIVVPVVLLALVIFGRSSMGVTSNDFDENGNPRLGMHDEKLADELEEKLKAPPPVIADNVPEKERTKLIQQASNERVVTRLILADIGRLSPKDRAQAFASFNQLDEKAIPEIVDGLNYSARMGYSCPVRVIESKLLSLIDQCEDQTLLSEISYRLGQGVSSSSWSQELARVRNAASAKLND